MVTAAAAAHVVLPTPPFPPKRSSCVPGLPIRGATPVVGFGLKRSAARPRLFSVARRRLGRLDIGAD